MAITVSLIATTVVAITLAIKKNNISRGKYEGKELTAFGRTMFQKLHTTMHSVLLIFFTSQAGQLTFKFYLPDQSIYLPWASGQVLMSNPALDIHIVSLPQCVNQDSKCHCAVSQCHSH